MQVLAAGLTPQAQVRRRGLAGAWLGSRGAVGEAARVERRPGQAQATRQQRRRLAAAEGARESLATNRDCVCNVGPRARRHRFCTLHRDCCESSRVEPAATRQRGSRARRCGFPCVRPYTVAPSAAAAAAATTNPPSVAARPEAAAAAPHQLALAALTFFICSTQHISRSSSTSSATHARSDRGSWSHRSRRALRSRPPTRSSSTPTASRHRQCAAPQPWPSSSLVFKAHSSHHLLRRTGAFVCTRFSQQRPRLIR